MSAHQDDMQDQQAFGYNGIGERHPCSGLKGLKSAPTFRDKTSHDTYLNGVRYGWPHDHSVDDTYEVPPHTWTPVEAEDPAHGPQYAAEFTTSGGAILVFYPAAQKIAAFETMADAQTAAKALNEHKGY